MEYSYLIEPDIDPIDPIKENDNFGKIVTWHGRYNLGHEQPQESPQEWFDRVNPELFLPVYMYDHSGITIRTTPFSCPWDSGQIGWIYAEDLTEFPDIESAMNCLRAEVAEYDRYLRGESYGFRIMENGEEIDSCYGFDSEESAESEARAIIEQMES